MKLSAILLAVASASAASIGQRQVEALEVTGFSAECPPHNSNCYFSFNLPGEARSCSATQRAAGVGGLPDVPSGTCTGSSNFFWNATHTGNTDIVFKVFHAYSAHSQTPYCRTIPASEIVTTNGGAVTSQKYVGPAAFTASSGAC